ncbi:MAG: AAA family ATPase [Chitinophagales bacterium]|jgi:putative ATP-dependent endonuclease of OLD family|nr:AAA family ATPase [Chitinophagales bacterium]
MILIDKVRIKNFRSLKEVEVNLGLITLLVGANNAGKTTFLRALNTVFGFTKTQINSDDLFIDQNGNNLRNQEGKLEPIIIDVRIVPVDNNGTRVTEFDDKWGGVFGGTIGLENENQFFAFRTQITFLDEGDKTQTEQYFISNWDAPNPQPNDTFSNAVFKFILLYFMDAQRDLQEEAKLRNSYFGKLATQLKYEGEDMETIKRLITELNQKAVENAPILTRLQNKLSELNRTTQTTGEGVSISPFAKNIRDLHKGMKVYFQDNGSDSFSLEYHGMGTRSWASILSFNAFIDWEIQNKAANAEAYFPLLALEEPEAHLHPNAQRTLYKQLKAVGGQKIISTHSPYIAAQAELHELRHFYKAQDFTQIGQILLANPEEDRKVRREVMNTRGELLFAKAMILFEGETEEQVLPILAAAYLGCEPYEIGLNFIGVGGNGNYAPFLNMAKFLNIPCYIISDNDGNTQQRVENQITGTIGTLGLNNDRFFLPDANCDFEKSLVDAGLNQQLVNAINECNDIGYFPDRYIDDLNGQKRKGGTLREYKDANGVSNEEHKKQALLDCLREGKTEYATAIGHQLAANLNADGLVILPPVIKSLFDKIKTDHNL